MLWKRIVVREMESALVMIHGRLDKVLTPGVHRIWTLRRGVETEIHKTLETMLTSAHAAALVRSESELVDRHFIRVSVGEGHVALIIRRRRAEPHPRTRRIGAGLEDAPSRNRSRIRHRCRAFD